LFTFGMSRWWPVQSHSIEGRPDLEVVVDGRVGGLIVERTVTGTTHPWGEITQWDPPRGFACRWYPGHPVAEATDLAVAFSAVAEGTAVELTHTGWEIFGVEAEERRRAYDAGWEVVLAPYAGAAG
jgi:uncharacterized protein YndB with AHSA1/START domain